MQQLREVRAVLPYTTISSNQVKVDIELSRLTILLGPNASGKTSILESIGYALASAHEPNQALLDLMLTSSLRPQRKIPQPLATHATIDSRKVTSIHVKPSPEALLSSEWRKKLVNMIEYAQIETRNNLAEIIMKDIEAIIEIISQKKEGYRSIIKITEKVIGNDITVILERMPLITGIRRINIEDLSYENIRIRYLIEKLPRIIDRGLLKIIYHFQEDRLYKSIVIEGGLPSTYIITSIKYLNEAPGLIVYHPGFVY